MDVLWKNLVYSTRMLLKRPSLTAVAIIAIGLGIGANTAIFSVVNTVLLHKRCDVDRYLVWWRCWRVSSPRAAQHASIRLWRCAPNENHEKSC